MLRVPCPRAFRGQGFWVRRRMPKGLKRYYGQHHLHFITCSCYRRLPLLRSARAKNTFTRILGQVRQRYGFALVGYVVMPEHIYLLMGRVAAPLGSREGFAGALSPAFWGQGFFGPSKLIHWTGSMGTKPSWRFA